jgi:hypothetical protein
MKPIWITAFLTFSLQLAFAQTPPTNAPAEKTPPTAPPVNEPAKDHEEHTLVTEPGNAKKAEKALAPIEKDLRKPDANQGHHFGLHVAAGLPHPLTAGLDYLSPSRTWGASLITGSFSATVSDTKVGISNMELQLRYHPWSSAFYVGLGGGNHTVKAERTETISGFGAVNAEAEVKAAYVSPQIGWLAMWDSGFTLGFQIGAVIPSGTTTEFTTDAPALAQATTEYQQLEADVKDEGDKYGKMTLPYLTLLRIGWLF